MVIIEKKYTKIMNKAGNIYKDMKKIMKRLNKKKVEKGMDNQFFCRDNIKSYILFTLANHCMPTLKRIKPSSLITFYKRFINNREKFFSILEKELQNYSCKYEILCETQTASFVLIYIPEFLNRVFVENSTCPILQDTGYLCDDDLFTKNLQHLKIRYNKFCVGESDFPHEVGIFLGYPLHDVEDFIKYQGENYIICGYWKVYHNVEEACNTFRIYRELRKNALVGYYRDLVVLI